MAEYIAKSMKGISMRGKSVLVGLSGGVDSAFAAWRLKEEGYAVEGAFLLNGFETAPPDNVVSLAGSVDIPLQVLDVSQRFKENVVHYFIHEYGAGRTPNPCVLCNKVLKFKSLIDEADKRGFDYVATGHYARVIRNVHGSFYSLYKGIDSGKDQSYFLFRLGQEELSRTILPNGDKTKESVLRWATERNLAVASRPESQEICFIPGKSYRAFLEKSPLGPSLVPGPIIDIEGRPVGSHKGLHSVTIGQRKGLSIASRRPYYVVAIHAESNTVVVGRDEDQFSTGLRANAVTWVQPYHGISLSRPVIVKIRYRHKGVKSDVTAISPSADRVSIIFDVPQKAVAPGQAAVFYDGDMVIGGGIIEERIGCRA